MSRATRWGRAFLLVVAVAGCSLLPSNHPIDAVRGAVTSTAAHDLPAAAAYVCVERRLDGSLPFTIEGITGAVDGLPFEEGFAMITFDATGLVAVEERRDGDEASVRLSGVLVESIDPVRYETAYRASVAARGEPVDQELLDQVVGLIGNGRYDLPVDQSVRVIRRGGAWQICPLPATP
ncbi:MAG TPA: hypothetical protein VFO05_00045 [Candidatus Limnocylindrales bacterium]|nr:hypothetical protein [Candidatus Limnocylindrales bacterium]